MLHETLIIITYLVLQLTKAIKNNNDKNIIN